MSFRGIFRQQKLKFYLSANGFWSRYTRNHHPLVVDRCIHSRTLIPVLNNPDCILHSSLPEFHCDVRFYAAPFQANQKKEERDPSGPRLNEEITAPSIRLVTGEVHFVISRREALDRAKWHKMDLVEVDRHANPPVCKILDYHKEKYIQQTKEKERAKSKLALKKGGFKEVRFAAKIKQKDLQIKADMVKRLMESGHRVKCTAIEPTDDMDLGTLLSHFSALIEDVAIEETGPQIEKKQAYIVVRHVKFGPPKKGSGNKAFKAAVSSNSDLNQNSDTRESGSETESGNSQELWAADAQTTKSGQSVFGENDTGSVFDDDEESMQSKSSMDDQMAVLSSHPVDGNPRQLFEPAGTSTPFLPSSGTLNHAMGNRYARDPKSARSGHGAGNNRFNGVPQSPTQGRQPQYSMNPQPQTRSTQQDSSGSSPPNSPAKSYGIFSSGNRNLNGHEKNAPAETNRYKRNGSSARNPNMAGNNSPNTRGSGFENPSQGRWGVFSTDNKNENQAEIHRR